MSLKDASREVRLQWFARQVIDATFNALDVCGADIQHWAHRAGLIDDHTVTEADLAEGSTTLEDVSNAECLEVGDTWFSFSDDLKTENVRWSELST